MNLELNETQAQIRDVARRFARERLAPMARQRDRDSIFPEAELREAGELGLLGVNVPEAHGGSEAGVVAYAAAIAELAEACASTTVAVAVTNMVAEQIVRFGTEAQKAEALPELMSGKAIAGAFALSESHCGSDAAALLTTARRDGGDWVLDGAKLWISHGDRAGWVIVFARSGGPGAKGVSAFLVRKGTKGMTPGKPEHKMGLHGSTTVPLVFEGCRLPAGALLGVEGEGFKIAMSALDGGRIGISAQAIGVLRACLAASIRYAKDRKAFGAPIATFQAIQWKLSAMATDLAASELLCFRAAALKEAGKPFTREASMSKVFCTEAVNRHTLEAVQIHGGYGYIDEFPVERLLRDARVQTLYEGTSEIQRKVIAQGDSAMKKAFKKKAPKAKAPKAKAAKQKTKKTARKVAARKAPVKIKLLPTLVAKPASLDKAVSAWRASRLEPGLKKHPLRREKFFTDGGIPIPDLLTAADRKGHDDVKELGFPGEYPFTRGPQASMYRGRLWTMRQFAGFGSPEDTNQRFHYLLKQGMTGLSTAFDMPALMGYDCDHPMSRGEVGREGVAVSSLADFEVLFGGLPLDKVTTSMTINASAIIALAMYIAVAEKQGIPRAALGGTIQADILKEYIAQKEWIIPPRPAVRLVIDMIEFCAKQMPKWHPVSISGYHIREAGATAVQELAFTLADGFGYVEECVARGMPVDSFAPNLSFFWDVHNDFFEEIAKFRAARRLWARELKARYHAKDPRSWMLKTHAQTAGVSLTAQQPYNNVVRVALQGMAAVLGGTQSLHTNSLDETYALPTEEAVTIALRTQQVIGYETGVDRVVDPLAGSYYVEYLTDEMERRAFEYIQRIRDMGGILRAVEEGYPQRELAESAYQDQRKVESGERTIVGINRFADAGAVERIPTLKIDEAVTRNQIARLHKVKAERDSAKVEAALRAVREASGRQDNLVEPVLAAVNAYATLGEICDVFREAFGTYREAGAF